MSSISTIVAAICGLLGLAGTAYFVLSAWAARRYLAEATALADSSYAPAGQYSQIAEGHRPANVRGVSPAIASWIIPSTKCCLASTTRRIRRWTWSGRYSNEFPQQNLRIVHCPQVLGLNGKVSNLAQMLPQARFEHVLINDSDIVVSRDYLRRVMAPFADAAVGMSTTLYRAVAGNTLGSKLEALGLSTDFAGGVLLARAMEGGIRFGLGATIATTKSMLVKIGGLEQLADYLGDDYELGARTAAAGAKVVLTGPVVETALPDYGFGDFWLHQIRWARNVKDRRPSQYFGLIVTFGLAWAILAVLIRPFGWWTWAILCVDRHRPFCGPRFSSAEEFCRSTSLARSLG